jgi:HD-GYP domain-containing protein (c-di-GMP phosphodiesterase class II)
VLYGPTEHPGQPARESDSVRLAELIGALSLATDLGMGQPMEYAMRSCVLAVRLGQAAQLDETCLSQVFYVALLRFVGCMADAPLAAETFGDEKATRAWLAAVDWGRPSSMLLALLRHQGAGLAPARRASSVATALAYLPRLWGTATAHCEVGQLLASRLGLGGAVQDALGQVYERWDGRGIPRRLRGEEVALPMRVVLLANDAITFHHHGGVEAAVAVAQERSGGAYDPRLVEVFVSQADTLLAGITAEGAWEAVLATEPGRAPRHLAGDDLDEALTAMSNFSDIESPSTVDHSTGVARLVAEAGRRAGLSHADVRTLKRAALVHDLGRVSVPAGIWEKPGPLNQAEWERVRLHPYMTERILGRSTTLGRLGALAAQHHERLDGSGYHRGTRGAQVSRDARLLAAADVYHALLESRPYRLAISAEQAAHQLRVEVRGLRLDGEAVDAVLSAAAGRSASSRPKRTHPAGLSEREIEVLRLLARGLPDKEIARALVVSARTVHHHVEHIYNKLGVSTRAAATLFAMQHELLDP